MAQWLEQAEFFKNSDRVPVMEYLHSVPRVKPLGSAITSVFVATFAMLSVMWTIFSLIAGTLAKRRTAPEENRTAHTTSRDLSMTSMAYGDAKLGTAEWDDESEVTLVASLQEPNMAWNVPLARLRVAVERQDEKIRISLARITRSLKLQKNGILKHADSSEDEMGLDLARLRVGSQCKRLGWILAGLNANEMAGREVMHLLCTFCDNCMDMGSWRRKPTVRIE
ncbi:hypothetical protein B0H14DRAFT_3433889 [Mycena olivaceomarginata]|nr:hypothetical protein B0H14DRAFT_3433889 [Mycena olivaceomarginata]